MNDSAAVKGASRVAYYLRAETVLDTLFDVLGQEIEAIAHCDFDEILRIGQEKEKLVVQLKDAAAFSEKQSEDEKNLQSHDEREREHALKKRVSHSAGQVRAMMRANSALLGEAQKAISAKLGLDTSVQSYDRRARTVGRTRRPSSKSI